MGILTPIREAHIRCIQEEILPGRYSRRFEWIGEDCVLVRIDWWMLEKMTGKYLKSEAGIPRTLNVFPWPLRLVSREIRLHDSSVLYARVDSSAWVYWAARFHLLRLWQWLKPRLILTAMVWGWAHVPAGEVPSWGHMRRRRH